MAARRLRSCWLFNCCCGSSGLLCAEESYGPILCAIVQALLVNNSHRNGRPSLYFSSTQVWEKLKIYTNNKRHALSLFYAARCKKKILVTIVTITGWHSFNLNDLILKPIGPIKRMNSMWKCFFLIFLPLTNLSEDLHQKNKVAVWFPLSDVVSDHTRVSGVCVCVCLCTVRMPVVHPAAGLSCLVRCEQEKVRWCGGGGRGDYWGLERRDGKDRSGRSWRQCLMAVPAEKTKIPKEH